MSTTYTKPTETDWSLSLLKSVMDECHPSLALMGVRVGVLFAYNSDGPAVKHAGYAALAKIKNVPLKDRVTKGYDAELLIDEQEWKDLSKDQQAALLDHELSHLRLVTKEVEKREVVQIDDIGRPKLKTVPGDWNAGDGFKDVVARRGEDAIEFENVRRAHAYAAAALQGEVS
jgi:hypothetical protein